MKIKVGSKETRKEKVIEWIIQRWPTMDRIDYRNYLRSDKWRRKRAKALKRAKNRCQVCSSPRDLQVHHRTYSRIGKERAYDLIVLCEICHRLFHDHGRLQR